MNKISAIIYLIILVSGCTDDDILDTMKRDVAIFDQQQNHSVYFKISDSGQTQGYGVSGQDSDYSNMPAMSFTDNGNGTVKDNVTGLVWTKCSMGADGEIDDLNDCSGTHVEYKWQDAKIACENLVYAGISNWALPTYAELFSLVNFGKTGKGAVAIDDVFPLTEFTDCYYQSPGWSTFWTVLAQSELTKQESGKKYWTSTKWSNQEYAHFISFDDGFSNVNDFSVTNFVRCVSSNEK